MNRNDLVVTLDRFLPASPTTVFRAFTEPDLFARWMGPVGSTTTVAELDVRIGGRLAFNVSFPGGPSFDLYGYYEDIDPPRRLVHSWIVAGDDDVSTVTFELEDAEGGTRLRLQHHDLSPEAVARNEAGWGAQLDRLDVLIADVHRA